MDSIARGLTALSPSIGQAEDFIAKKGIPQDQVPAFLASLGDPQLAGLIAQKQKLKQEQAKQVPPGGPQKSPPTVKDEINMQLAQLMQAKQQQQAGMPPQGGQPPQPGMPGQPPMPPQGGQPPAPPQPGQPPVQAASGGLMGMGLGGLDAGSMEAPHHFDGGGVVALAAGGTGGSSVKSKEEIEKEKAKTAASTPSNPYADVYSLGEQQIKDIQGRTAYQRLEDPTIKEREDLYAKRLADAKREYEEDLRNSRDLANADALEAAFSGKSLGRTVAISMKSQKEKQIAARDKYSLLQDKLQDAVVNLHVATQANKESDNKETWQDKRNAEKEVAGIRAEMAKTKVAESEADFEHKYKTTDLALKKQEVNKSTEGDRATADYVAQIKAEIAAGKRPKMGEGEIRGLARSMQQTAAAGLRTGVTENENYTSAIAKVDAGAAASTMRRLSSTPDDPRYIAAKKQYDQQIAAINSVYPEQSKAVQSGQGGSGGTIDFSSLK